MFFKVVAIRNPTIGTATRAEGFDLLAYHNIERIERLQAGKEPKNKRKPA